MPSQRCLYPLAGFFISLVIALQFNMAQAAETRPCDEAARLAGSAAQKLATDPGAAEKDYLKAIGLCQESAALRYNLAMLYNRQNRFDKAITRLTEAIQINPSYCKAYNALAYIMATQNIGDQEQARQYAKKAIEIKNWDQDYQETYSLAMDVDLAPKTGFRRPNAVAVVIGNRDYRNPDIPKVEFAVKDAALMKQYLIDTLGYPEENIIAVDNAELSDFYRVFGNNIDHRADLFRRIRLAASHGRPDVFIYYAGHGAPQITTSAKGEVQKVAPYILPASGSSSNEQLVHTAYPLELLYDNLKKIANETSINSMTVVMDACFSGGSGGGTVAKSISGIGLKVVEPGLDSARTAAISSSSGAQVSSWYPEKKHSSPITS